jgi:phosphohistidine swiveling domain-containing protein
MLSHPAIIAREYGVPAVVATGTATTDLHDGQLVTVDGSAGTVVPVTG